MKLFKLLLVLSLLCLYSSHSFAQMKDILDGVHFGQSAKDVQAKMEQICETIKAQSIVPPSFPLAQQRELHLICLDCEVYGEISFDTLAFTFSDSKLNHAILIGEGVSLLSDIEYVPGYKFFTTEDHLIIKTDHKKAFFLTDEGLHLNLFAWESPYASSANINYDNTVKLPSFIKFGSSVKAIEKILSIEKRFHDSRISNDYAQINCYNIVFGGFPRKFELQFYGDQLKRGWILTAKQEENRLFKLLEATYGSPIFQNEDWDVFNDWKISLRKDKPEILFLSEEESKTHKKNLTGG